MSELGYNISDHDISVVYKGDSTRGTTVLLSDELTNYLYKASYDRNTGEIAIEYYRKKLIQTIDHKLIEQ